MVPSMTSFFFKSSGLQISSIFLTGKILEWRKHYLKWPTSSSKERQRRRTNGSQYFNEQLRHLQSSWAWGGQRGMVGACPGCFVGGVGKREQGGFFHWLLHFPDWEGPTFWSESQLSKAFHHIWTCLYLCMFRTRVGSPSILSWSAFTLDLITFCGLCRISTIPQVSGIFIPVLYCLSLSTCSSLSYLETQQQQHVKSPLYLPSLSSSFLSSLLSSQNLRSCLRNSLGSSSLGETDGGSASYCKFSENIL